MQCLWCPELCVYHVGVCLCSLQQLKELGLPRIQDVVYVGCPATGRDIGVADLRKRIYDVAFSLTLPRGLLTT